MLLLHHESYFDADFVPVKMLTVSGRGSALNLIGYLCRRVRKGRCRLGQSRAGLLHKIRAFRGYRGTPVRVRRKGEVGSSRSDLCLFMTFSASASVSLGEVHS